MSASILDLREYRIMQGRAVSCVAVGVRDIDITSALRSGRDHIQVEIQEHRETKDFAESK